MTSVIAAEVYNRLGIYHNQSEASKIALLAFVGNLLWILTVNITKASILTQYLRLFSSRTIRTLCYALLASLVPAALWAIFGGVFLCSPVSKLWNPGLSGECRSAQTYWLSVAGLDIGLDLLVLLLPLPFIVTLRIPPRQKTVIVALFTLGFFVCGVSIARLVCVLVAAKQGKDIESALWAIVWSSVEANVGIICASLLALKPLVAKLWPSAFEVQEIPERCMRIATVETSQARVPSSGMISIPVTPSTDVSKDGRWGLGRWSPGIEGRSRSVCDLARDPEVTL